uniref:Uncharacterized protein n=1 Tax=Esox lucius TaxID=8010 RepID=A0A3P8ZQ67_ESOLU
MAQCLLSEEQVQCFICQDVFSEPVSTPCGHNFCMACIAGYWDNNDFCQCPLCKRVFDRRPYLLVNTFRKAELGRREAEVQQMILERRQKIQEIKDSIDPVCKGDVRLAVSQRQLMEETVRTVSLLQEKLKSGLKSLRDAELKSVQCVAVDVTLDPDTAHARLGIFKDGREVRHRCNKRNVTDHPGRFGLGCCVLGKEGFSSGRFYYEVLVRGKTRWELGVARESMDRKKRAPMVPHERLWTLGLRSRNKYNAISKKAIHLSLSEVPQKVGVFVDYEGGQVSFYDVGNISHIYSFTGCNFVEKLYPYFCPFNKKDANEAPLVISPVKDSDSSSDSYADKDSSMDSD